MDLTSGIALPTSNFPTQLDPSSPLLRFIPSPASAATPNVPTLSAPLNIPGLRNPFSEYGANRGDTALPALRQTGPALAAPTIPPPSQPSAPSIGQVLANNSQLLSQSHDLISSQAQARQQAAEQRVDYLTHTGSGVDQIAHPLDANGNPTTQHPGFWRTLGSIGAHIGDDVLSIAAPGVAALTPGTTLHHQMLLNQAEGQEGQAQNELQGQATLARANADTANENAATNLLLHPRPEYQPLDTAGGIVNYDKNGGMTTPLAGSNGQPVMPYVKPGPMEPKIILGPDGKTPVFANYQNGQYLDAQGKPIPNAQPYEKPEGPKSFEHVSILGDNGKPTEANYDPASGIYKDAAGNVIKNPCRVPPPPSYGQLMLPTKTITAMVNGVPTIMQWDEKNQSYDKPAALSASGSYAHEEEQAAAVQRMGEQVIGDLQANRGNLGTLSAWVQKHGLNTPIADPTLAGLQSELAGFAALQPAMHGFRSHSALETFNNIIGGVQNNPDATIASIRNILKTAGAINPALNGSGAPSGSAPGAQGPPYGMVQVQIPGHAPGYIPPSALKQFKRDHPNAQVTQ